MDEPTIGENVRYYRKLRGWVQQELADAAGININSVSLLESGSDGTKLGTILAVAKALHLHPADLFRRQSSEVVKHEQAAAAPTPIEISPATLRSALFDALKELATASADRQREDARDLLKSADEAERAQKSGRKVSGGGPVRARSTRVRRR